MRTFSQQNQPAVANESQATIGPVSKPAAEERADRPLPAPPAPTERPRRPHTLVGLLLSLVAAFFWVGIGAAFLSGYLGPDRRFKDDGPPPGAKGRRRDDPPQAMRPPGAQSMGSSDSEKAKS